MQGAIKYEYDFTLETVKLYKKLYPKTVLIVSTWEEESEKYLKKIENVGVIIIKNSKPDKSGHGSINYQLKSTKIAIDIALSRDCEYILKTRTDQRLYGESNISYLLQLLNDYPINISVSANARIIICSNGCFSGRLYNISDMILFGMAEDILAYFSCPYDCRNNLTIVQGDDLLEYSKKRPGEIYFSTNYIEYLGFDLKWTEEDSMYFIKELFLIVDNEALDWYWPKYTDSEYRWRDYSGSGLRQLTHKDWKRLQVNEN